MSLTYWPGGCVLTNKLYLIYCHSFSEALADSAPDEVQWQHAIRVVTSDIPSSGVYSKSNEHCSYYGTEQARDTAFSAVQTMGGPGTVRGSRIIFRVVPVDMILQGWEQLERCEQEVADKDQGELLGQFTLKFWWSNKDVTPTLVRYKSEEERDADAALLYQAMKGRM